MVILTEVIDSDVACSWCLFSARAVESLVENYYKYTVNIVVVILDQVFLLCMQCTLLSVMRIHLFHYMWQLPVLLLMSA